MHPTLRKRIALLLAAGLLGSTGLLGIYFGLVSWAESPAHAADQFRTDAVYIAPILLGFGVQAALFAGLRWRLLIPAAETGASGAMAGASGGTSAVAMAACCAHHVSDVLPVVGLSAATSFLASYRELFLLVGLVTTLGGMLYMLRIIRRERRLRFLQAATTPAA